MKRLTSIMIFLSFCVVMSFGHCLAYAMDKDNGTLGVEFGLETSYIKYKEPNVMEEKGVMYGVCGALSYRGWIPPSSPDMDRYLVRLEGRFSYGQVDYKNSGTIDNIDDYIGEIRGLAGYDFSISRDKTITPYIGIGYRYLNDDSGGMVSSTGAKGYERESNYLYSPLGVEFKAVLDNGWSISAMLEYDYFWKGVQKSHLSDADPGYNDMENDQNKGYGLRGSLKFVKRREKIDFIIEPFIRYWSIAKSEEQNVTYSGVIIGYGYEPKNKSLEVGLNLSALY